MKLTNITSKKNTTLLKELVITDFKLRYQGSALGYAWSVLKPLFLFAILYLVFDKFLGLGRAIEHFPVYLLIGVVLWNFFAESTNLGLQSIINRGDLIRKINFPKYIIVISGTISSLINLAINIGVVCIFAIINCVDFSWTMLLIIPLVIELYIFALSIAFLLSALNVKYRDTSYLWEVFMQAAFYATPILYPLQMVYGQWPEAAKLLMLNPVAQVIQDVRQVFVTSDTLTLWDLIHDWKVIIPFAGIILTMTIAVIYFRKKSKYFAEEI